MWTYSRIGQYSKKTFRYIVRFFWIQATVRALGISSRTGTVTVTGLFLRFIKSSKKCSARLRILLTCLPDKLVRAQKLALLFFVRALGGGHEYFARRHS